MDYDFIQKQFGGPISGVEPDEYGNLQKFVYGGDEYAYGGDVLHKAYDGYITNFQKQMNATKNRIDQMGSKKPEDLLGNPFKGNPFGKATTGIQPSGTVGNRFQPTGQPNTGTTSGRSFDLTKNQGPQSGGYKAGDQITFNQNRDNYGSMGNQNQMAQYMQMMQMMQGQQGNPFMGNAFGNQQFSVGRPQRLGFGLTRDFNYSNAFSPVNWQVPEGTKKIREVAYKDRGKWYNPFDTKRVREWYADPEDGAADDLINKQGSGKNINTGTTSTETQGPANMPGYEPGAAGPGLSGFNADSDGNQIPDYLEAENPQDGTTAGANSTITANNQDNVNSTGSSKPTVPVNEQMGVDKESWDSMSWQDQTDMMNAVEDQTPAPTRPITVGAGSLQSNPNNSPVDSDNPYVQDAKAAAEGKGFFDPNSVNIPGNNPRPNMAFPQNQPGGPLNEQGIIRREYGGYIPEYMAYGGYMPEAKSGITVDKKEFSDPDNLLGRIEESAGYTADLGQLATDVFSGPTSLTGLPTGFLNTISDQKNIIKVS
jgi:hypothetical protein